MTTPAAIEFQHEYAWGAIRDRCHHLARDICWRINDLTGLDPIYPEISKWFGQMNAIRLPELDTEVS